jgi:hypothetical protein
MFNVLVLLVFNALVTINSLMNKNALITRNFSKGCLFQGNDMNLIETISPRKCKIACKETVGCTHFTWIKHLNLTSFSQENSSAEIYDGACYLKTGQVSVSDAVNMLDDNYCGFMPEKVKSMKFYYFNSVCIFMI